MNDEIEVLQRFAQHLASELVDGGGWCHLAKESGGRCKEPDAAVRWENGFADVVCEHHAETAPGTVRTHPAWTETDMADSRHDRAPSTA